MTAEDRLRHALQADADRAPDADAVLDRIHGGLRRRQLGATVATAVAAAVIVLGAAVGIPHLDRAAAPPAASQTAPPTTPPAAPTTPVAPAPVPLADQVFSATPEDARRAFAGAGYEQDDARALAEVWRWLDTDAVTVVAGLRLLDGADLPLRPGQAAAEATEPGEPLSGALQAYGAAGYGRDDAAGPAARWGEDPDIVMVFVGQLLLDGDLPS